MQATLYSLSRTHCCCNIQHSWPALQETSASFCGGLVCLQLGRIPEDVLAVITGKLLQGLAFMHAKHMVSKELQGVAPVQHTPGMLFLHPVGVYNMYLSLLKSCIAMRCSTQEAGLT